MSQLVLDDLYRDPLAAPFRFRQKRFAHVARLVDAILAERGSCRILDLGGETIYWEVAKEYLADRNVEITLVNLSHDAAVGGKFRFLQGDATRLGELPDGSFDLVHSNSVIEHVGTWQAMEAMARNVRRLAPRYFVQTPNFWFPVEPHFRAPLFHWLPEQLRCRILMRFDIGFAPRRRSVEHAMRDVQSAVLLDRLQFQTLFPDATIERERVMGLTKSLMAIRG